MRRTLLSAPQTVSSVAGFVPASTEHSTEIALKNPDRAKLAMILSSLTAKLEN